MFGSVLHRGVKSFVVVLDSIKRFLDSRAAFLRINFNTTWVIAIAVDIVNPLPEQPQLRKTMTRSSQVRRWLRRFSILDHLSLRTGEIRLAEKV